MTLGSLARRAPRPAAAARDDRLDERSTATSRRLSLDALMRLLSVTPHGDFLGRVHEGRLEEPSPDGTSGYTIVAETLRGLSGRRDDDERCVLAFAERMLVTS